MTPTKIYLVVLESDKKSITSASFDQYTAQQLCHRYAKATGTAHGVVREIWNNLSHNVRCELSNMLPRLRREWKEIVK